MITPLSFFFLALLSLSPPQAAGETPAILADFQKELHIIAKADSREQMRELLRDRDRRVMKALQALAQTTNKTEKAPGIAVENGKITVKVENHQNLQYLSVPNLLNPIFIELTGDTRSSALSRLRNHGLSRQDLETLERHVPADFDVNQWTIASTMDYMHHKTSFGKLIQEEPQKLKSLNDDELKAFLTEQSKCVDYVNQSLFISIIEPLSTHGRLVVLQLCLNFQTEVSQSRSLFNEITQKEVNAFRQLLNTAPSQK
ncbi:hypothetical protein [Acanthopleuribacter pedis]|uniref:Uncharacterized protein n=1 Tax=Acanthopleuribacter pedis TaxID=442870 RepID=A0A8J7U3C1_9BACT|nr:hypothetical protein [Acanthopleuribacter pedis]MBO1320238.1 hypothetical protein [Acanthopleuribacter pedis]